MAANKFKQKPSISKKHFLSHNNILLKDFPAYANQVTNSVVSHVEKFTADLSRPLIYLNSAKDSKEAVARKVLNESPVSEGLICTLSAVEYCSTLQPKKDDNGMLYLAHANRKCKYFYCYFQDKEFGFMHVKLQTWFPFLIQVYINGRELMKHVFDENGITYQMYDNSFCSISDLEKAQALADAFDSKKLCRQLDMFAEKLNSYLDIIEETFHQGYHWCVDQCEYATDVMFKSREALEDIYPSLVEHAFHDFKIYKRVNHKDGSTSMRWSPMGKSIANLYRYAEISKGANLRYISALTNILPKNSIEKELNEICQRKQINGRAFSGFNVWESRTFQLFDELCSGRYLIRGFTNADIRSIIYSKKDADSSSNRNRLTRLFSKLRAYGLIKKIPRSHQYLVTEKGRRIMSAIIETKKRIYPELDV